MVQLFTSSNYKNLWMIWFIQVQSSNLGEYPVHTQCWCWTMFFKWFGKYKLSKHSCTCICGCWCWHPNFHLSVLRTYYYTPGIQSIWLSSAACLSTCPSVCLSFHKLTIMLNFCDLSLSKPFVRLCLYLAWKLILVQNFILHHPNPCLRPTGKHHRLGLFVLEFCVIVFEISV